MKRSKIVIGVLIFFLLVFYVILYRIYIPRINAFGCFDDCNNFMGGYFLLHGKRIFSDFFFNHQPMAAYISYLVQMITNPENVFALILRHRQFMLIFAFLFNVILILRFRFSAFFFAIVFELSKFYLFGDRFLSEGMIVYPLIYLVGLVILKLYKEKIKKIDYILAPIFTWFIIFSREPYVPLAILLFAIVIFNKKITSNIKLSVGIFFALTLLILFSVNIQEYFFNVVTVNYKSVLPAEKLANMPGNQIAQSFFYPFYIFFYGPLNVFKNLLIGISGVFIILTTDLFLKKKYILVLTIFLILALANIRIVLPGILFYGAFHMLCWYGLFIFISVSLILKSNKFTFYLCVLLFTISFVLFLLSPNNFMKDKVDIHTEFITNYGNYLQIGNVVRNLSTPKDTLFLDGKDDLIYWQAKRESSYKYSWYTSAMVYFSKYTDSRIDMFLKSPPDFYYGTCVGDSDTIRTLPKNLLDSYIRLYNDKKPSCLWVKKTKLPNITDEQWKKAAEDHFFLRKEQSL